MPRSIYKLGPKYLSMCVVLVGSSDYHISSLLLVLPSSCFFFRMATEYYGIGGDGGAKARLIMGIIQ